MEVAIQCQEVRQTAPRFALLWRCVSAPPAVWFSSLPTLWLASVTALFPDLPVSSQVLRLQVYHYSQHAFRERSEDFWKWLQHWNEGGLSFNERLYVMMSCGVCFCLNTEYSHSLVVSYVVCANILFMIFWCLILFTRFYNYKIMICNLKRLYCFTGFTAVWNSVLKLSWAILNSIFSDLRYKIQYKSVLCDACSSPLLAFWPTYLQNHLCSSFKNIYLFIMCARVWLYHI